MAFLQGLIVQALATFLPMVLEWLTNLYMDYMKNRDLKEVRKNIEDATKDLRKKTLAERLEGNKKNENVFDPIR